MDRWHRPVSPPPYFFALELSISQLNVSLSPFASSSSPYLPTHYPLLTTRYSTTTPFIASNSPLLHTSPLLGPSWCRKEHIEEDEKSRGVDEERNQEVDHKCLGEGKRYSSSVLRPQGARDAANKEPAKGSPRTSEKNGRRTLDVITAEAGAKPGPVQLSGVRTRTQNQRSPKPTKKYRQQYAWRPRNKYSSTTTASTTRITDGSETTVRIKSIDDRTNRRQIQTFLFLVCHQNHETMTALHTPYLLPSYINPSTRRCIVPLLLEDTAG